MAGYEPGDPYTAPPFARPLRDEVGVDPGPLAHRRARSSAARRRRSSRVRRRGRGARRRCWRASVIRSRSRGRRRSAIRSFAERFRDDRRDVDGQRHRRARGSILGRPVADGDLEPDNLTLGALGRSITGPQYVASMLEVHRWCRSVLSWWHPADGSRGFDVLVTPTHRHAAAADRLPVRARARAARMFELLQYTAQFNVTGQPAISLPLHMTADGLPVGVQFVRGLRSRGSARAPRRSARDRPRPGVDRHA